LWDPQTPSRELKTPFQEKNTTGTGNTIPGTGYTQPQKITGIFLRILRGDTAMIRIGGVDPHGNQLFGSYDLPMEWFDLSPMFVW
jgi:hypothetical protein